MQSPKVKSHPLACQVHQLLLFKQMKMRLRIWTETCIFSGSKLRLSLQVVNQRARPQAREATLISPNMLAHLPHRDCRAHYQYGLRGTRKPVQLFYLPENKFPKMQLLKLPIFYKPSKYTNKFHWKPKGILKYQHIKRKEWVRARERRSKGKKETKTWAEEVLGFYSSPRWDLMGNFW